MELLSSGNFFSKIVLSLNMAKLHYPGSDLRILTQHQLSHVELDFLLACGRLLLCQPWCLQSPATDQTKTEAAQRVSFWKGAGWFHWESWFLKQGLSSRKDRELIFTTAQTQTLVHLLNLLAVVYFNWVPFDRKWKKKSFRRLSITTCLFCQHFRPP